MKPKQSMLDYCKKILRCVSFDRNLFKKEFRKSITWLSPREVKLLKQWIRSNNILAKSIN
jgi:hypothetical protein